MKIKKEKKKDLARKNNCTILLKNIIQTLKKNKKNKKIDKLEKVLLHRTRDGRLVWKNSQDCTTIVSNPGSNPLLIWISHVRSIKISMCFMLVLRKLLIKIMPLLTEM